MRISQKILLLIATILFSSAYLTASEYPLEDFYLKGNIEKIINGNDNPTNKKYKLEKYREEIKNTPIDFQIMYYKYLHNIYYKEYNRTKSMELADILIEIFEIKKDRKGIAEYSIKKAEDLMGYENGRAEFIIEEALKTAIDLNDDNLIIFANSNLASVKSAMGFHFEALDILNNAELFLTEKVNSEQKIELFSEIAFVYDTMKNFKKAKLYYIKVIDVYDNEKYPIDEGYIYALSNLADLAESDIEITEINESIEKIKKEIKDDYLIFYANQIYAKTNVKNKDALNIIDGVIHYFQKVGNKSEELISQKIKLDILSYQNKSKEIIELINKMNQVEVKKINHEKINELNIIKYKHLALAYKDLKDLKRAYENYVYYEEKYKESYSENFTKTIRDLKIFFNVIEKEEEVDKLRREAEGRKNKIIMDKVIIEDKERVIYGMYIILIIIILITLVIIFGYKKITRTSRVDDLTQVLNRMTITDLAKKMFDNENEPLSVTLMDIDFFKKINDHYGHNVGDEVLREVSRVMKEALGNNSYGGRYGGEEFLIVSKLNHNEACELAEVIRKKIQDIRINEYPEMRLSASFGVSCREKNCVYKSVEDLIKKSDERLYMAKGNGRNKVVCNS